MSLTAVVRKEFHECRRSYTFLGLTACYVLFAVFFAAIRWVPQLGLREGTPTSTLALLNSLSQPGAVFVPLVGIAVGYQAIAGERDRGSLRLGLSLPNTRRELVAGKFFGRFAAVALAIAFTSVAVGLVALATYPYFDTRAFLLNTAMTVVYGGLYLAIAVGFSAFMETRRTALLGAMGLYVLFLLVWDALVLVLQVVFVGPTLPEGARLPDWIQFVALLNPTRAFEYAKKAVLPEFDEFVPAPESDLILLQDWVGFLVLPVWVVLPLVVGSLRFQRTDVE